MALLLTAACSRLPLSLFGPPPEAPADPAVTAATVSPPPPAPTDPPVAGVDFSSGGDASPTPVPSPTPTPLAGALSVEPTFLALCRPAVASADCPATASIQAFVGGATVSAEWQVLSGGNPASGASVGPDGLVTLTDAIGIGIHFIQASKADQTVSAVLKVI